MHAVPHIEIGAGLSVARLMRKQTPWTTNGKTRVTAHGRLCGKAGPIIYSQWRVLVNLHLNTRNLSLSESKSGLGDTAEGFNGPNRRSRARHLSGCQPAAFLWAWRANSEFPSDRLTPLLLVTANCTSCRSQRGPEGVEALNVQNPDKCDLQRHPRSPSPHPTSHWPPRHRGIIWKGTKIKTIFTFIREVHTMAPALTMGLWGLSVETEAGIKTR